MHRERIQRHLTLDTHSDTHARNILPVSERRGVYEATTRAANGKSSHHLDRESRGVGFIKTPVSTAEHVNVYSASSVYAEFRFAIVNSNTSTAQQILAAEPELVRADLSCVEDDSSECTEAGLTALHLAAMANASTAMLKLLINEYGADTEYNSSNGMEGFGATPLQWACRCGHFAASLTLISLGADPKCQLIAGASGTWGAIRYTCADLACMGYAHRPSGVPLQLTDKHLTGSGHAEILSMLKRQHQVGHSLTYLLHCMGGVAGRATHLYGADAKLLDISVAEQDRLRTELKRCVKKGIYIENHKYAFPDEDPLNLFCHSLLLPRVTDVLDQHPGYISEYLPGFRGKPTVLHIAAQQGHVEAVSELLKRGADVSIHTNFRADFGAAPRFETPLHAACVGYNPIRHRREWSPQYATVFPQDKEVLPRFLPGHTEVVRLLIEHGADVNVVNSEGCTPLHLACEYGNVSQIEYLLDSGARNDIWSKYTWTGEELDGFRRGLPYMHALACGQCDAALMTMPRRKLFSKLKSPRAAMLLHAGWHNLSDKEYVEAYHWLSEILFPVVSEDGDSDAKAAFFSCLGNSFGFAESRTDSVQTCYTMIESSASTFLASVPPKLAKLALSQNVALPPVSFTPMPHRVTQAGIFGPLTERGIKIVDAELVPRFEKLRQESIADTESVHQNRSRCKNVGKPVWGDSIIGSTPQRLFREDVFIVAIAIVSHFLSHRLKSTLSQIAREHGEVTFPPVKTVARMTQKKIDYADLPEACSGILDSLRLSLVSANKAAQEAFLELLFRGTPNEELIPVRCKSTMQDNEATVKMELWNFIFAPGDTTFHSMTGGSRLVSVKRSDEFGDIATMGTFYTPFEDDLPRAPRSVQITMPISQQFRNAIADARAANPEVSTYGWAAATDLLCSPALAFQPVKLVIEVQLHLSEFLVHRKRLHLAYKIVRAGGLRKLSQDCCTFSNNPEMAYHHDDDAELENPKCSKDHLMSFSLTTTKVQCSTCAIRAPVGARLWICSQCNIRRCPACRRREN